MTITAIDAPATLKAEECTNFDMMALRRRAITFTKAGATMADAMADVEAMPDAIVPLDADVEAAKVDLAAKEVALADADEAGAEAAQTAVDAAVVALEDAIDARRGVAENFSKNAAWYNTTDGLPEVDDVSGPAAYSPAVYSVVEEEAATTEGG